jgi:ABC-type dipeptide/oligopeptide/nickel transport system ATPase component
VSEVLRLHQRLHGTPLRERVLEALRRLRISAADTRLWHYPHQFSGGMGQRVSSAIALSCAPRLLIADEPTTSLDVRPSRPNTWIFSRRCWPPPVWRSVTHDFGIVAANADRVAVMYAGKIVEMGTTLQIFNNPRHP